MAGSVTLTGMDDQMVAVTVGDDETLKTLTARGLVAVDWWASWCGPCKQFAPVFEQAALKNPDISFVAVDVEACPKSATGFSIGSVPTLMLFKDGQLVYSRAGAISGHVLDGLLRDLRRMPTNGCAI